VGFINKNLSVIFIKKILISNFYRENFLSGIFIKKKFLSVVFIKHISYQ